MMVCSGSSLADDYKLQSINVKADLVSAVCAVTGVSANKVQVFEGR